MFQKKQQNNLAQFLNNVAGTQNMVKASVKGAQEFEPFLLMTRKMARGDRGASRGEGDASRGEESELQADPNCRECGGLGVVKSTKAKGLGMFLGPYGAYGRDCPSCFPTDEEPELRKKLSLEDQLVALTDLHEAGVLTEAEYRRARDRIQARGFKD